MLTPPRHAPRVNREQPITWAVIDWLQSEGWPHISWEADIRRGLRHGRADVGATREDFQESVAVEVKAVYVEGSQVGQLFDARSAAEYTYFAAPPEVIERATIPAEVGVLEAKNVAGSPRPSLIMKRRATRGQPEWELRKDFLHALMRSASRRGRFNPSATEGKACPACQGLRCPFWIRPSRDLDVEIYEV